MSVASPSVTPRDPSPVALRPKMASSGRLRGGSVTESDRNFAIGMHLSPLVLTILGLWPLSMVAPLVIWLIRRRESVFDDDHGREIINFVLSFLLWHLVLLITVVGMILWPVLWVVALVNCIRGAIAAGNGEYFRYPMTIRFLS
jgi:uncharacterized Tic20 family protein